MKGERREERGEREREREREKREREREREREEKRDGWMLYLRASHSKKFDFLLVPLTQYEVKKIMKMTIFLHLPFLFWP